MQKLKLNHPKMISKQYDDVKNLKLRTSLRKEKVYNKNLKYGIDYYTFQKIERILDLGCGAGYSTLKLLKKIPDRTQIVVMDISHNMVKETQNVMKQENREVLPITASAHNLPFCNRCFDVIFSQYVFFHLDMDKTLKEIKRVLKAKGHLIAITVAQESVDSMIEFAKNLVPEQYKNMLPDKLELSFTNENGFSILSSTFSKVKKMETCLYYPFRSVNQFISYFKTTVPYQILEKEHAEFLCDLMRIGMKKYLNKNEEYQWNLKISTFIAENLQ